MHGRGPVRRPSLKVPLLVLVSLTLCAGTAYLALDYFGERAWQQYAGKTPLKQMPSARPPVPDDENFLKTPFWESKGYKGRTQIPPFGTPSLPPFDYPEHKIGDFRKGTWTSLASPEAVTNNLDWQNESTAAAELLEKLQPSEALVKEMRETARRKHSRFDFPKSFSDQTFPNFVLIRSMAHLFSIHAHCELIQDGPDEAMEDLRVLERIAEGLRDYPTLISTMIRTAIMNLDKQVFYEGWARNQWREEHYAEFQRWFSAAGLVENLHISVMLGDRKFIRDMVETRDTWTLADDLARITYNEAEQPMRSLAFHALLRSMPHGWWRKNLQEQHRIFDIWMTNTYALDPRRIFPRNIDTNTAFLQREIQRARPFHQLAETTIPSFSAAARRLAEVQTTADQASIVCALERHRIQRGHYPGHLSELVPEFMPDLPEDLITGAQPVYRLRKEGTWLLYSFGWDGRDDGGRTNGAVEFNKQNTDFVWPFPPGKIPAGVDATGVN